MRQASSRGNNRDANYGWGIIDADDAIRRANNLNSPPLTLMITGPNNITQSGTYTWQAQVGNASTSNLRYRWNNGPETPQSSYSRYVAVNSGSGTITLQVIEQDRLERDITGTLHYVTGGLGGPIEQ